MRSHENFLGSIKLPEWTSPWNIRTKIAESKLTIDHNDQSAIDKNNQYWLEKSAKFLNEMLVSIMMDIAEGFYQAKIVKEALKEMPLPAYNQSERLSIQARLELYLDSLEYLIALRDVINKKMNIGREKPDTFARAFGFTAVTPVSEGVCMDVYTTKGEHYRFDADSSVPHSLTMFFLEARKQKAASPLVIDDGINKSIQMRR